MEYNNITVDEIKDLLSKGCHLTVTTASGTQYEMGKTTTQAVVITWVNPEGDERIKGSMYPVWEQCRAQVPVIGKSWVFEGENRYFRGERFSRTTTKVVSITSDNDF